MELFKESGRVECRGRRLLRINYFNLLTSLQPLDFRKLDNSNINGSTSPSSHIRNISNNNRNQNNSRNKFAAAPSPFGSPKNNSNSLTAATTNITQQPVAAVHQPAMY